jgi:hypothetical protein
MLITTQPIERAEEMARLRFSFSSKMLSGVFLLIASSEMVPGAALLMSLLH